MTTKKSTESKFARITLTLSINSINGPIDQPVAAHSIGTGLAWHERWYPPNDRAAKSKYKYRVSHIPSGRAVWDFRLRKHAEQFIREVSRIANFNVSEAEITKAVSGEAYNQMRSMASKIDGGTYTPGCSL